MVAKTTPHTHRLQLAPEEVRRLGYRIVDLLVEHEQTLPQWAVLAPWESRLVTALAGEAKSTHEIDKLSGWQGLHLHLPSGLAHSHDVAPASATTDPAEARAVIGALNAVLPEARNGCRQAREGDGGQGAVLLAANATMVTRNS